MDIDGTKSDDKLKIIQRIMAHGFAGCCGSFSGAVIVTCIAYATSGIWDDPPRPAQPGDYARVVFIWVEKAGWIVAGFIVGGLGGFLVGAVANVLFVKRAAREEGKREGPMP